MSKIRYYTLFFVALFCPSLCAEEILIAAASDMKFVMQDIVESFNDSYPDIKVKISTGSSGKFYAYIKHGAPYDVYFSADISYPQRLASSGLAGSEVIAYAKGRLVLLSGNHDVRESSLKSLADPQFERIAIASPKHAPYGVRAKEALVNIGLWQQINEKLIFGDSVTHTAQFIINRHVDAGIVALSLVKGARLPDGMYYSLLPESLHQPLLQGFMVTCHGEDNKAAWLFKDFMQTDKVSNMLRKYGFDIPTTELQ